MVKEKIKKIWEIFKEAIEMQIRVFKTYKIPYKELEIPKEIMRKGYSLSALSMCQTFTTTFFAFLLKMSTDTIKSKMILLGLIIFFVYQSKEVIYSVVRILNYGLNEEFNQIFADLVLLKGNEIISKTDGKVYVFNEDRKIYSLLNKEDGINALKRYLSYSWRMKAFHKESIVEIISVIILIITAVITNTEIEPIIFIPFLIGLMLWSVISTAIKNLSNRIFHMLNNRYTDEQFVLMNDLLRVPNIVKEDFELRINKFKKSMNKENKNRIKYRRKENVADFTVVSMETISKYLIIFIYICQLDWNSISVATITELVAMILIIDTIITQLGLVMSSIRNHSENMSIIKNEEKLINNIMNIYYRVKEEAKNEKEINKLYFDPFTVKYLEESQNDTPFSLISENILNFKTGDIVILYGPSGSGKSTFMKMVTKKIVLKKDKETESTSRALMFDETLKFGSLSMYDELFCGKEPNLEKMEYILENLGLWKEIESKCKEKWKWLKEKNFNQSLSNGQKQRMVLAKILYWIDDNIDVIALDECTSGLDDNINSKGVNAEDILQFITEFVNKDKKRIVFISTHQNIDGFIKKNNENIKILDFETVEGESYIKVRNS